MLFKITKSGHILIGLVLLKKVWGSKVTKSREICHVNKKTNLSTKSKMFSLGVNANPSPNLSKIKLNKEWIIFIFGQTKTG